MASLTQTKPFTAPEFKDKVRCGFCCKSVREVRKMAQSAETGICICDQCAARTYALTRA